MFTVSRVTLPPRPGPWGHMSTSSRMSPLPRLCMWGHTSTVPERPHLPDPVPGITCPVFRVTPLPQTLYLGSHFHSLQGNPLPNLHLGHTSTVPMVTSLPRHCICNYTSTVFRGRTPNHCTWVHISQSVLCDPYPVPVHEVTHPQSTG